ncbi:MAG: 3-deoxy-7-phosphoheptulonate synthase [Verrucomicrobia bacterium]|nr:3-deoxy-7-phosphoheptulonate synthase [Verrucomicrobiota bacterium]
MIIVLRPKTEEARVKQVEAEVRKLGYEPRAIRGEIQTVIAAIGDERGHASLESLATWPQVESVLPVQRRYKLVAQEGRKTPTVVKANGVGIGGAEPFCLMAGPCSVESEEQLLIVARAAKKAGATFLRGGAFKPRTSPYEFQGLGEKGLELLALAKKETGLGIITEVLSELHVDKVAAVADILQIGARNSQNFSLLKAAAGCGRAVLLKRGLAMKVEEWLLAAEYVMSSGNGQVILCERGIRTFETAVRNTLDLGAVALAKRESHLPVIVDPSQGAGRADLVIALSRASAAIGADGLLVEVHPHPAEAKSDGQQQLDLEGLDQLVKEITPFVKAAGRCA